MSAGRITLTILVLLALSLVSFVSPAASASTNLEDVYASRWVIMDAETGVTLDGEQAHQQGAMASLTKVMTALVAVERGNLDQQVTIVEEDLIGEASAGLREGEDITLRTLLHGLLLRSGNDAAMAIARAVGGSPDEDDDHARERFYGWMNQRADDLNLSRTHFRNPHGLDEAGHHSSAYDLAMLTRAATRNPDFLQIFSAEQYAGDGHNYDHSNQLFDSYDDVIGGKTGWTNNAGLCLIQVVEKDGQELIVVLLGSTFERWYADAADLLDYGWTLPRIPLDAERAGETFAWWQRQTDGPVSTGDVSRSWLWGPSPSGPVQSEPYEEAIGGERYVQYFDKGRMEINDPYADYNTGWAVTGGRLAAEMIDGHQATGDTDYIDRGPAEVHVAGDASPLSPTYSTLKTVRDDQAPPAGTTLQKRLMPDGSVTTDPALADYDIQAGSPIDLTGHGVADIFATYLNQTGPMIIRNSLQKSRLFEPPFALVGLPITPAYWQHVPVDGQMTDVLVQCFERRCLTYTPSNPDDWKVEMGNIGQHYQRWINNTATGDTALFPQLSFTGQNCLPLHSYRFGINLCMSYEWLDRIAVVRSQAHQDLQSDKSA